jgi:hypothetical protein
MKKALLIVSCLVLAGIIASSLLCANGMVTGKLNNAIMLAGTVLWFGITPFWMKKDSK